MFTVKNKGSVLLFVLILAALFASAVLTLTSVVNLSYSANNNMKFDIQLKILAKNTVKPYFKKYYMETNEFTYWYPASDGLEKWYSTDVYKKIFENFNNTKINVESEVLVPKNDDNLIYVNDNQICMDNNAIFPYCWVHIFSDRPDVTLYPSDGINLPPEILNSFPDENEIYTFTVPTDGDVLSYDDAFLYWKPGKWIGGVSYQPKFWQSDYHFNKSLLPSDFKNYECLLSVDAENDLKLEFISKYEEDNNGNFVKKVEPIGLPSRLKNLINVNEINSKFSSILGNIDTVLRLYYSEISNKEIYQYILNLKDSIDTDSIPTIITDDGRPVDLNDGTLFVALTSGTVRINTLVIGKDRNICINEVWPDSDDDTSGYDEGEFIELFNPFDESIDISNWVIAIYRKNGDNYYLDSTYNFSQVINGRSFLVLTDDYDDRNVPNYLRNDNKSLFDSLGINLNPNEYEIIPNLNLPDNFGRVELWDNEGHLIDYFEYENMRYDGVNNKSAQRYYPLVANYYYVGYPTPGNINTEAENRCFPNYSDIIARLGASQTIPPLNRPFFNKAELLLIPTYGYVKSTSNGNIFSPFPLRICPLTMDKTQLYSHISTYIMDIFYIDLLHTKFGNPVGEININTCPYVVLKLLVDNDTLSNSIYNNIHSIPNDEVSVLTTGKVFSIGEFLSRCYGTMKRIWDFYTYIPANISFYEALTLDEIFSFAKFADFITVKSSDANIIVKMSYTTPQMARFTKEYEFRILRDNKYLK